MNNIITLKRLVELLAAQANIPSHKAQIFLDIFTYEVKTGLTEDKYVKIKDFGEFRIEEGKIVLIPDASIAEAVNAPFAMFEPEVLADGITQKELSEPIAPVIVPTAKEVPSAVESSEDFVEEEEKVELKIETEIKDKSTEKEQETIEIKQEPIVESKPIIEKNQTHPIEENEELPTEQTSEAGLIRDSNLGQELKTEVAVEQENFKIQEESKKKRIIDSEEENAEEEAVEEESTEKEAGFPTFWVIIGLLTGLILGIGIGFFVHDPIQEALEPTLAEEEVQISDEEMAILDIFSEDLDAGTIEDNSETKEPETMAQEGQSETAEVKTAPEAYEVKAATPQTTDVKPATTPQTTEAQAAKAQSGDVYDTVTTNLAALSKKHYGDKSYWVYIYLENQSQISNPNRVGQNIKLKIPPLEKYATQSTEAERKSAANKKAAEILAKYK